MNQGPRYVRLMEKSTGQKYRATVPLSRITEFDKIPQIKKR
jgi:hypothetical protein